ncbi:hypothetical protein NW762_012758 [Fusarium torreyae]|uniref:Uncharacterized protein n=1 Tax=Fusarium torreyae TaxID=1237075 RepID=A0A9W8RPY2_9HYPO|nr:hypothetical protein NW762_012758 [Fusarium torreyae]
MLPLRPLSQITAFLALLRQTSAGYTFVLGDETITGSGSSIDGNEIGTKCPGILSITGNNNDGFCCVGGNPSTCKGWPLCASTASVTPVSCATKIPISASDYTALIESASSKYLDGGDAKPSSTADSTMATATSETTSDEEGTDATSASAGQASSTGDSGNDANDLKAPLMAGIAVGALALCLAL